MGNVEFWFAFDSTGTLHRGTSKQFRNLPEPLMAVLSVFEDDGSGGILGEWLCGEATYLWNERAKTLTVYVPGDPIPVGTQRRSGVRLTDEVAALMGDIMDPIFEAITASRAAGPRP